LELCKKPVGCAKSRSTFCIKETSRSGWFLCNLEDIPIFPKVVRPDQKNSQKTGIRGRSVENGQASLAHSPSNQRLKLIAERPNQWLKRVLVIGRCSRPRACYSTRVFWTIGQTSLLELIFKVSNHFLLTDFAKSSYPIDLYLTSFFTTHNIQIFPNWVQKHFVPKILS
jgi:hypothetical protein